ncbi:AI-2E family transporter [Mucilaginibacter terrae]|uniref:PurR-regulated permease PerM n=1 Tax=Mucilaginibacter terrae TaxID=1955052 RepID=A0ABU3GVU4_9SPHI|nr:AI-2E family transporter [Mucilaginibacter terrae]MDT3403894.1 putative PurR-regulated permease PerM [Mucilaginibacter terrae]
MIQLSNTLRILLLFILSVIILYFSRSVLIPLTFGGVLAMLLMPVSRWLESKGLHRGVSSLVSLLLFALLFVGLVLLLRWQIGDLIKDFSKLQEQLMKLFDQVKDYVRSQFGITTRQQQQILKEQQSGGMEKVAGMAMGTVLSTLSILVSSVLVLVYVFLFLYFRSHFKNFVLRLVDVSNQVTAQKIMHKSSRVIQQYLSGLGMMIVMLWVMYGIGFSIVGVQNAIFFAILCGILEIIPFAGNITGTSITVLIVFAQGGSIDMVMGVLITYGIVQFTQSYLLEPLVVGNQVNLNPLFTIFIIVVGEAIWGIGGMVLAIPLLGMFKVLCDHIEPLKPYGYLIGNQSVKEDKSIFKKLFGSKDDDES